MGYRDTIKTGTIFITGISASGKSTMGRCLKEAMNKGGLTEVRLIDGEETRRRLLEQGRSYGYSPEDRKIVALEMARMAFEYNSKGVIAIICSICHTKALRQEMRAIIGNVFEVYLDCPVEVCARRDYKGQYSKAFQGLVDNFIGVAEPYQRSDKVELVLNTAEESVEKCAQVLFRSAMVFLREGFVRNEKDASLSGGV